MALIRDDRIAETTTTTGTGALTLAGAITGYRTFASAMAVADTCYYVIEGVDAAGALTGEWEIGLGSYSAASTFTRTTVHKSSNANAAVVFSVGTKRVMLSTTSAALTAMAPSDPALAAHLYWQILIPAGNGSFVHAFAGLQFRATAGGADQCTGGTPFARDSANGAVTNAFDGNATTYWASGNTGAVPVLLTRNVGYQFATAVKCLEVAILARPGVAGDGAQAPTDFSIQWSDDGERFYTSWQGGFNTPFNAAETKLTTRT